MKIRRFSVLAVLVAVVVLQTFVSLGDAFGRSVAAQRGEEVFVITGSTDIKDCSVVVEESADESFKTSTIVSGPEACQGGVVWAERTTLTEEAIRSANRSVNTRVVALTGNAKADQAAVQTEAQALHRQLGGDDGAGVDPLVGTMGYMSASALPGRNSISTSAALQSCNDGSIGEVRRSITLWRAIRPQTRVRSEVSYKRVNCQQWRIFRIRVILLDPPVHSVYYRELRYERIWSAAQSRYVNGSIRPGCNRLDTNWEVYSGLQTIIRAGFYAQHEVEDDEFNGPFHCQQLGNSYTSVWFMLPGGRS